MEEVSGLAEESKKFASFLTVTIWGTIFSQTNIFIISPASASLASVGKILEGIRIRKTRKYIPQSARWISRLFIELANRDDRVSLTLDCSGVNKDGPGSFRTEADKPDFQTSYFNLANDEQAYNEFVSKQINESERTRELSLRLLILRVRPIEKRTLMLQKNFTT